MVYITAVQAAKLVRRLLKKEYGRTRLNTKFSVSVGSSGSSLNVRWTDGPTTKEVDRLLLPFVGASFDGMTDMESNISAVWTAEMQKLSTGLKGFPQIAVGERTGFMSNYIFTRRSYSESLYTRALEVIAPIYDINPAELVFSPSGSWGAHLDRESNPDFLEPYKAGVSTPCPTATLQEITRGWLAERTAFDEAFYARELAENEALAAVGNEVCEAPQPAEVIEGDCIIVRRNLERDGIEIVFPESLKPDTHTRSRLSLPYRFRFKRSPVKLWWIKFSEAALMYANNLAIELNQLAGVAEPTLTVTGVAGVQVGSDEFLTIAEAAERRAQQRIANREARELTAEQKRRANRNKIAERLESLADNMQASIDEKFNERATHTARYRRIASSMIQYGTHLQKVQLALRAVASSYRSDLLPVALEGIKSKKAVDEVVRNQNCLDSRYISQQETYAARALEELVEGYESAQRTASREVGHAAENANSAEVTAQQRIQESEVANSGIDGFFPTPDDLGDLIASSLGIQPEHIVLDPSAGYGSLLQAAIRNGAIKANCYAVEINRRLHKMLSDRGFQSINDSCFNVGLSDLPAANRIIQNPAFERGHAPREFRYAFEELLKPEGRIACIMPSSVQNGQMQVYASFREWLLSVGGTITALPERSFAGNRSARQTSVNTCLVTASKSSAMLLSATTHPEPVSADVISLEPGWVQPTVWGLLEGAF